MEEQNKHNHSFENDNTIPKQNNFKIPEGYFEQLSSRMENELEIKNESPKKGILRVLAINISIAAAVVLGVFLFNPEKKDTIAEYVVVVGDGSDPVLVEDYMISMVDATEDWSPLDYYPVVLTEFSEEEVEAIEMPVIDEVTSEDLTDFFEDEDEYEF